MASFAKTPKPGLFPWTWPLTFRLSPCWQTQGPFFPADSHFGSLLNSLRREPEVYIWRLHPRLPNGFKRHPEYSSFLLLWAPWQFPPKVKAAVNSEVPFSEYQFILNSGLVFFLLLSTALGIGVPEISVNAGHCLGSEQAGFFFVQIQSLKTLSAPQPARPKRGALTSHSLQLPPWRSGKF